MNYTQDLNKEFNKNSIFLDRNSLKNAIEIGCFEGRTSNYIMDNILSHDGTLICIDPLDSEYEYDSPPGMFVGQYERFIENTKSNSNRVVLYRKRSIEVLESIASESQDLIFIDGHHEYTTVKFEAEQAYRICKPYGYILFDDYLWGNGEPIKRAIDEFLDSCKDYKLLLRVNQVLIQKLPQGSGIQDGQSRYQEQCCEKLFNENTIYAAYCNLDSRPERNEAMINELRRVGIKMERQRSFPWRELWDSDEKYREMGDFMVNKRKTAGALGCWVSQMEVMKKALEQGKHAFIAEDDIIFCDDFPERLKIIYEFLNTHEWDVFWFGGHYHRNPTWHKSIEGKHTHPELKQCRCNLNRDWEPTNNPHINRTFGAFSTHAYMINKERIQHLLNLMERDMHFSMGIDWFYILHQPDLYTYAFDPGCIKQYSSQSNIGNGWSNQDFSSLGEHWWQKNKNYK